VIAITIIGSAKPMIRGADAIARLRPGVLGEEQSLATESHAEEGLLEYPQYTRPEVYKAGKQEWKVPEVLLSGNHAEIAKWREGKKRKM
jgi:tRNA (guanine37-N1)-methyltransferase